MTPRTQYESTSVTSGRSQEPVTAREMTSDGHALRMQLVQESGTDIVSLFCGGDSPIVVGVGLVAPELRDVNALVNRVRADYPEATLVLGRAEQWFTLTFSTEDGDLVSFGANLREAIDSFSEFDVAKKEHR